MGAFLLLSNSFYWAISKLFYFLDFTELHSFIDDHRLFLFKNVNSHLTSKMHLFGGVVWQ